MPLKFFHPRFWLTWLGVVILRLLILLPWPLQMSIGKITGLFLYKVLPSRRKVSCINLEIAFPNLSKDEIHDLNRQHFINLGQTAIESALGWWGSDKSIQALTHIEGIEHLNKTLEKDNVILIGAHFAPLEIGGRIMALNTPLHGTYRPHQNALIDFLVTKQRSQKYGKVIPKNNIRDMIKSIKAGSPVWYAADQNYRGRGSILVPFFGVDAPTNPGTSRLAKMSKAKVMPVICVRLLNQKANNDNGYLLRFLEPLDNFPSNDLHKDATHLNTILEGFIKEFPEQYLWTHKRYKNYARLDADFYENYAQDNSNSACHT